MATLITVKSAIVTYTRDTRLFAQPFKITSMSKSALARRAAISFAWQRVGIPLREQKRLERTKHSSSSNQIFS